MSSDGVDSQSDVAAERGHPGWLLISLAWLGWLGLDLCLAHRYGTGLFTDPKLTRFMQLGLVCQLAIVNGGVVLLVAAVMAAVRRLTRTRAVKLGKVVASGLMLGTLFGIIASWSSYDSTGSFADSQGLRFSLAFPVSTAAHAIHLDWANILFQLGALAALSVFLVFLAPRLGRRLSRQKLPSRLIHFLAACLLGGAAAGATAAQLLLSSSAVMLPVDEDTGVASSVAQLWQYYRDDHLAPAPAFLANYRFEADQRAAFENLRGIVPRQVELVRPLQLARGEYGLGLGDEDARRWNVIVCLVESLRRDLVLPMPGRPSVMPNLEALASRSRVYRDVYTQASHSNYADLCPLNSQFPLRSTHEYFYPRQQSYPRTFLHEILAEAGYATAVFSSQDEGWGGMINLLKPATFDRFFHSGEFAGFSFPRVEPDGQRRGMRQWKLSGKIDDRLTVTEAVDWIGRQSRPFFVYLNLQSSHVPYVVPEEHPIQFGPRELDFAIRLGRYPREKTELARGRYWDSLNYVDVQLGALLKGLKRHGQGEKTLLVLTGDTGQAFFEHGFSAHANQLYNEVLQVPLVLHYPGVKPGYSDLPMQHVDVPPLVLSLLGMPPHPGFQGRRFERGEPTTADPPRFLISQTTLSNQLAVVQDGWKLIFDLDYRRFYLYNLGEDPGEKNEVGRQYPERARELATTLASWADAQLDYYGDTRRQTIEYPPRLKLGP